MAFKSALNNCFIHCDNFISVEYSLPHSLQRLWDYQVWALLIYTYYQLPLPKILSGLGPIWRLKRYSERVQFPH